MGAEGSIHLEGEEEKAKLGKAQGKGKNMVRWGTVLSNVET